jgi:hypothetical protein
MALAGNLVSDADTFRAYTPNLENRIIPLTSVDRLTSLGFGFHFGEIFEFLPWFQGQKVTSVDLGSGAEAL